MTSHLPLACWTWWHMLNHGFTLLIRNYLLTVDLNVQGPQMPFPLCCIWEVLWHRTWTFHGIERFMSKIWTFHGIERFMSKIWTFMEWRGSCPKFDPSWNREVHVQTWTFPKFEPSRNRELHVQSLNLQNLNLRGIERFMSQLCTFVESKGSWLTFEPSWNLEVHVQIWTFVDSGDSHPKFEPSWNREVHAQIWTFVKSRGPCPNLNFRGFERFMSKFWTFVKSRGSCPNLNLRRIERFMSKFEFSWNREVMSKIW